jgi:hypothetical protein
MSDPNAAAAMATTMQQVAARAAKAKKQGDSENDPVFRPGGGLPADA